MTDDLKSALKQGDKISIDSLRTVLHIVDNASAVPVAGINTETEVSRRIPGLEEVVSLLKSEAAEMDQAAAEYRKLGVRDRSGELSNKACVVRSCISYLTEE